MKFPVFDLHCDTAYALLGKSFRECGSLRKNSYHVDLERAGQLPGYAQCFACYTTPLETSIPPAELFNRELEAIMQEVERNADCIALAYSPSEIERKYKAGIMSAILTLEGPAGIDYDPSRLPMLYSVGFRMSTLGWNESNPLCGSHITGEGLTDRGRAYVSAAQQLGMIIDLSHISDQGFWDVMRITEKPLVASHSNSRKLCAHSRNLTDDMFRAICDTNGVVGINLYADFLGAPADLDTVCDHVFHFMDLDPDGTHICLGGDLDGCDTLPADFTGVQDYNKLSKKFMERGMSSNEVMNVFWNNALGVMKRCYI